MQNILAVRFQSIRTRVMAHGKFPRREEEEEEEITFWIPFLTSLDMHRLFTLDYHHLQHKSCHPIKIFTRVSLLFPCRVWFPNSQPLRIIWSILQICIYYLCVARWNYLSNKKYFYSRLEDCIDIYKFSSPHECKYTNKYCNLLLYLTHF